MLPNDLAFSGSVEELGPCLRKRSFARLPAANLISDANVDDLARLYIGEHGKELWHKPSQVGNAIRPGVKHNNTDPSARNVLLESQIAVYCYQVCEPGPPHGPKQIAVTMT